MIRTGKENIIQRCQISSTPQEILSVSQAECQNQCTSCIWLFDGQCHIYQEGTIGDGNSVCGFTDNCNLFGSEIVCPTLVKRQSTPSQGIVVDNGIIDGPTYTPPPPVQSASAKQDYTLYYIGGAAVFLIILITMFVIYYIRRSSQTEEYPEDSQKTFASTSIASSPMTVSSQMTVNNLHSDTLDKYAAQFKNVDTMDGIVSPYPKRNVPLSPAISSVRMSGYSRESTAIGSPVPSINSPIPTKNSQRHSPLVGQNSTKQIQSPTVNAPDILPPMLHPSLFEK
ncbi:hypothetical protein HDV06_006681 [Boothiomyces sp. JEL0866]|nr:hypothetical protein HDV06_006681 [Boothiomyces sp. JEL0866]